MYIYMCVYAKRTQASPSLRRSLLIILLLVSILGVRILYQVFYIIIIMLAIRHNIDVVIESQYKLYCCLLLQ